MSNETQIVQWLDEVSDEEQDVAGSDSEDETVNDAAIDSAHDSESEIEESEDIQNISEPSEGTYFLSRHTQRNGPKVKWSKVPPCNAVRTRAQNIIVHLPGVKEYARNAKSPLECFQLFFDREVIQLLVTNTNLYIDKIKARFGRDRDALPSDDTEMNAFLGLLIMAGVLRASHLNFIDLWAQDGSGVEMFRLTMSYKHGEYQISNSPDDIVKRLVEPIKRSGRNITTDNWYTSTKLAKELLTPEYKLTLVGTLNKRKPDIPTEFLPNKNRPPHSSVFGFHNQMTIVSYVPKPKKAVVLLSTMHYDNAIDETTGSAQKPEIITYYNSTKGGVDCNDQLCSNYNVGRRTKRWPLAVFFHLVNVSGINAFVIHKANTDKGITHIRRIFLKQLAAALVTDHQKRRIQLRAVPTTTKKRLREVHDVDETVQQSTAKRGRCSSCPRKNDKKLTSKCFKCHKFICQQHSRVYCVGCRTEESADETD
ncbi:hypothetical protein HF086_013662 [Spodoptera exigua]|uniref:PiggyBac transposable element-derived protein domain-containing protein n=1 Tax=Spodoptera exigua TaxID=7107 RepID=A0A922SG07_SPOEX|nr:hypothetical protein HF086_013662 [Spodoptera exigua]